MNQSIDIATEALANPPADLADHPLLAQAQESLPADIKDSGAPAGAAVGLQSVAHGSGLDAKLQVGASSLLYLAGDPTSGGARGRTRSWKDAREPLSAETDCLALAVDENQRFTCGRIPPRARLGTLTLSC